MTAMQLEANDFLARAEARAMLDGGLPNIIVSFPPSEASERATVGKGDRLRTILRGAHETPEEFMARVAEEMPAQGGLAIMWPPDSENHNPQRAQS